MDVQLQYSYLLVVQSPDLFLAKTATDIWLFRKGQNVQRIGLLGWAGGGAYLFPAEKDYWRKRNRADICVSASSAGKRLQKRAQLQK